MLKDKVALITGSTRGIGKATALFFATQGAKVIINYSHPNREEEARKVVQEIINQGSEAIALCANIVQEDEVKAMIKGVIDRFGKLDILVNNAGITKDMLALRMNEQDFEQVISVNLKGTFSCSKYASRVMMKKGGVIINMSSIVALVGNIGQCNYAASKAGIIGLTKSMAKEFAGKGIRINAIAPGFIVTAMTDQLNENIKEKALAQIPLKRFGLAEEVAQVAAFLASDLSSYITGQVIKVDGGMVM